MGESSAKQQDDPVFVAFRRKLADVVTVAINSGKRVGISTEFSCPLGCHPEEEGVVSRPCSWYACKLFVIDESDVLEFARGFDCAMGTGPYAELGRLYCARFP